MLRLSACQIPHLVLEQVKECWGDRYQSINLIATETCENGFLL
jgi:hypothetical protein